MRRDLLISTKICIDSSFSNKEEYALAASALFIFAESQKVKFLKPFFLKRSNKVTLIKFLYPTIIILDFLRIVYSCGIKIRL